MAGREHGATLCRKRAQQRPDPQDAFRVQAVHRLVTEQDGRVAQQCRRQAQALAHSQRERPGPPSRCGRHPDEVEHFVDPPVSDAVALGEAEQVVVCAAPAVHGAYLEDGADFG
jgi:hypothetical protein